MRLSGLLHAIAATALATVALAQTPSPNRKPAVPPGRDPGGVAIAILSTGIDYTIPEVAQRLARDGEGELIGWDLVDNDRKPFDQSRGSTPPEWGGDATKLVKVVETSRTRVIPVRIDPADPASLAGAVAFVAQTPARLVVVPMWGTDKAFWEPFRQAASHFTDLLFIVAAGDDDKDIDHEPVWPAAFGVPNFLVVTTSHHPSQPDSRPNRGQRTVDAYTWPFGMAWEGDRSWAIPNTSRTAALQVANVLAGCWPQLVGSYSGESLKKALLAGAVRSSPAQPKPIIAFCPDAPSKQRQR